MKLGKTLKKILRFVISNYFLAIFFTCIIFVVVISGFRLFLSKPTYVYTRVKIGQGLWWASTSKAPVWFLDAFKEKQTAYDLLGKPEAEMLSVRYYPWFPATAIPNQYNQYDIFLTLKLKVTGMKGSGKYSFNRTTIGVGSPIDLEFPKSQFSGTVTEISENPIADKYKEVTVYLTKAYAYPWEYGNIKIGDKYFDGQSDVFVIQDKVLTDSAEVVTTDQSRVININQPEERKNIVVKARMKVEAVGSNYVFGEEQIVSPGRSLNIATNNFTFTDYIVSKVE